MLTAKATAKKEVSANQAEEDAQQSKQERQRGKEHMHNTSSTELGKRGGQQIGVPPRNHLSLRCQKGMLFLNVRVCEREKERENREKCNKL